MLVTYVGHLTHLFEDGNTKFLMDPLLTPQFGQEYSPRPVELYPPRHVDPSYLADLDAVLVTHEHFDHFNLESLDLLPRDAEVLVGPNMLGSVQRAIEQLGFQVTRQQYYETYRLGDFTYKLYPAAPDTAHWEKRVSQIFVRGRSGGSILLGVDALFGDEAAQDALGDLPTLIAIANNAQIPPPGVMGALTNYATRFEPRPVPDGVRLVGSVLAAVEDWPELQSCSLSITGGGFRKDYDEIGVFPFSEQNEIAALARRLTRREDIYGPMPGDIYRLADGQVTEIGRASWVQIDEGRFQELKATRENFLAIGGTISRSAVVSSSGDDYLAWPEIEAELDALARFMLTTEMGADVVETSKSRSTAFCFRIVDEYRSEQHTYIFDAISSAFSRDAGWNRVDQAELCEAFDYGVVISLSDLRALVEGRIQIWDLAGVAVDAWYSRSRLFGPLPLMYTWWGEQTVPTDYEQILQIQLTSLQTPRKETFSA